MMGQGIVTALLVLMGGGCFGGALLAFIGLVLYRAARDREPRRFDRAFVWLGGALSWVVLGAIGWNVAFESGETRLAVGATALAFVTGGFGPGMLLVGLVARIAARAPKPSE